jgi:hypothetical protein
MRFFAHFRVLRANQRNTSAEKDNNKCRNFIHSYVFSYDNQAGPDLLKPERAD